MKNLLCLLTLVFFIGCDSVGTQMESSVGGVCKLGGVYPDPVENLEITKLTYQVETEQLVRISIFDSLGALKATIVHDVVSAGTHRLSFKLPPLTGGRYRIVMNGNCEGGSPTTEFLIID